MSAVRSRSSGFREIPKHIVMIRMPPSVEHRLRLAALADRRSISETVTRIVADSLGIKRSLYGAADDDD